MRTGVAAAIADVGCTVVYFPAPVDGTVASALAGRGITGVGEIYPDLTYAPDGSVVVQRHKGLTDVEKAAGQVRRFLAVGRVTAEDGSAVELEATSVCVHGDGPNVVDVVRGIQAAIREAGVAIAAPEAEAAHAG